MPMLIGHRRRGGLVPVPVPVPVLFSSLVIGGKRADDGGQWTVVDGGGGGLSKGRGLMGATGCRWMVRCLAAMPLRWRCLFGHCRLAISCHLLPRLATPCHRHIDRAMRGAIVPCLALWWKIQITRNMNGGENIFRLARGPERRKTSFLSYGV